eukprot:GHVU01053073.1.p1 GENE.GHVU01053073.1~~GHVU01053073.1.p1  ORF type:complete len:266 (+),score=42.22 GHVU01053073.1:1619-2416(+)
MGIDTVGQVCVMIHTGSRGLGHQVATDYIKRMREARFRANKKDPDYLPIPDPQLECARVNTELGQAYLGAMSAAANFAWANRGMLTHYTRKCFQTIFNEEPDDLDMCLVYDVSHNIASRERHWHEGKPFELLVHRKGATRAFPPHHPLVPLDYQTVGQPVIVGGSMGTCSYILTGTETGMTSSFGSTCHGAGRLMSRTMARGLNDSEVKQGLVDRNIYLRAKDAHLVSEEAPQAYKNVSSVVDVCHETGISKKCVRLKPIGVIKG